MNIQEMSDEKLIELCINKNLYDIWHETWEKECGNSCAIHMAAKELSDRINKLKDDNKRLLNLLNRYIPLAEITKNDIQWVLEELKDNNRKE
jgi:hypothetical protein